MEPSPELKLRTASSLVDEVSAKIEPFKTVVARSDAAWDASFWRGLQSDWRLGKESHALLRDLDEAIDLAAEASASGEDPRFEVHEAGQALGDVTPNTVMATANVGKGILYAIQNDLVAAEKCLVESLKSFPTADAQLRLGSVLFAARRPEEAETAFRTVIETYPESAEAVEAMKALRELERASPKKWSVALILSILLGWLGIDRFYLGYIGTGFLKLITAGGWFIWWIIDIVRIATNTLPDATGRKLEK